MNSYVATRLKHEEKIEYRAHYGWTRWVLVFNSYLYPDAGRVAPISACVWW